MTGALVVLGAVVLVAVGLFLAAWVGWAAARHGVRGDAVHRYVTSIEDLLAEQTHDGRVVGWLVVAQHMDAAGQMWQWIDVPDDQDEHVTDELVRAAGELGGML